MFCMHGPFHVHAETCRRPQVHFKSAHTERRFCSAVMTLHSAALSESKGSLPDWAACMQDSKGDGLAGGDHHSSPAPKEEVKESLGKKKKGQKQQTLLFTTTQRRY